MIAHEETGDDKERVMSLYQYVKEYRESPKYEYKGGHHASPVEHPRSGYYRKCKHGSYILSDGEFKFVGKGLGKFSYVKPCLVNAGKDEIMAEML